MSKQPNDNDDKSKVCYVSGYNDPEADMVLKATKDGGLFRVHSYHLKSHSAYFRSMALPADLGTETHSTTPVDIDSNTKTLLNLLDQVSSPTPPDFADWNTVHGILQLGERYQFERLSRILGNSLQLCVTTDPAAVFVYASQHDLEPLAKLAVGNLNVMHYWMNVIICTLKGPSLVGATSDYVLALVRAMRTGERPDQHIDWKKASEAFKVYI